MSEIDFDKLFALAGQQTTQLERELQTFIEVLDDNFDLKIFLEDITVPAANRKQLLNELCAGYSSLFLDLLGLLIERDLILNLREFLNQYSRQLSKKTGTRFVEVTTADNVDKDEIKKIKNKIGAERIRFRVDPSLIGGIRIKWEGGNLVEATISRYLRELKENISA
jgi:ATP synthase F1 delta subunit